MRRRRIRASPNSARNSTTRSYTEFLQGAGVDRTKLAQALPPLPDTADELKAVAKDLGAPASDIHLGRDASETTVKRLRLADYRVVYFATHGLVAGDIKGLAEPSLALSIPAQPSDLDDGLLTASEVAQLKLNADWVVLSACNTIAGDKPGAEALSGLARAFFYAGARALLVSHWAVESQRGDAAHDLDLRHSEIRPNARPRRGAAPRHARLHERRHGPAECLSGALGAVRGRRRGGRAVSVGGNRSDTSMSEIGHGRRSGTAPPCFRSASVTGRSGCRTEGLLSAKSGLMHRSKQRAYSMGLEASTVLGSRIVKVEPRPGALSTVMSPPIIWQKRLLIASPVQCHRICSPWRRKPAKTPGTAYPFALRSCRCRCRPPPA